MYKKKKFISICSLMVATAITGGIGINSISSVKAENVENTTVSKINTNDEFLLGTWRSYYDLSVKSYEEQTKELAQAGLNFSVDPITYSKMGTFVSTSAGAGQYLGGTIDAYKQLNDLYAQYNMYYQVPYKHQQELLADEQSFSNAVSYYVKDEPSAAEMSAVVQQMLDCQANDPDRFAYVNLYPCYAGATNLGGTYYDYVSKYVNMIGAENLEYLSFDHYPFLKTESVRSTFFSDLETIRKVAFENGRIKTGGCPLLSEHLGYRKLTPDEAKWGYNVLLAYGSKILTGFVWTNIPYATSGEDYYNAVVNCDGTKTDLYDPLSILNWQVRQLGPTLMNIDVKHAYHTNEVPVGAERLPGSFIFQPADNNSDFVYSIAYNKNDSEKYVILFNKALDGGKKDYTINVDLSTGIKSITEYRPTDFTIDNLPDPQNPTSLGEPEQIEIDVTGGSFTVSMGAGDMKIFKLNGDVEIYEDLAIPTSSHKSGTYVGQQEISFITGDSGAEIWYTLDGSYPTPNKEGSMLYTAPIKVGEDGKTSNHTIRAVSARNGELSLCYTADLFISSASENVAYKKPVKFTDYDGNQISVDGFNGSANSANFLNDNSYSPTGSCLAPKDSNGNNTLGWAIVDLEKEYVLDKIYISFWHDWIFTDSKIQVATKEDFSDSKTVFVGNFQNIPYGGKEFDLSAYGAVRYIRMTGNAKGEGFSIFTEIQAYNYYDSGENLVSDTLNWIALGGSNWTNDGKSITLNGEYNTSSWDRAYGYTAKKYKNFILDCSFSFLISDPSAWGFFGVGLYRKNQNDVQGNASSGYYVGIEPKGRVLLWQGKEIGDLNANIAGWSVGGTTRLRIVSINDTIMVSVNNVPIMYEQNSSLDLDAGYVSLSAGLLPVEIKNLSIMPIDEKVYTFPQLEQSVLEIEETKISVAQYTSLEQAKASLPTKMKVIATDQKEYEISVVWDSLEYDGVTNVTFPFEGKLLDSDLKAKGLTNASGLIAKAGVYVRPNIDFEPLKLLINQAKQLNKQDYTEESWNSMLAKLEAAEALLVDEYAEQVFTDIAWGQLESFMNSLVSVVDKTDLQKAISSFEGFDYDKYIPYGAEQLKSAIQNGTNILEKTNASSNDVTSAINAIVNAKNNLQTLTEIVEKPTYSPTKPTSGGGCSSSVGLPLRCASALTVLATCKLKKKSKKDD